MRLDRERLQDILEAIEAIERYASKGKEEFDDNELVRVWCLRHLEIIGEATSKLSDDIRQKQPAVPWKQIIGMRNILIHGYFDVNWKRAWEVVANDIEPLKENIIVLLRTLERPDER